MVVAATAGLVVVFVVRSRRGRPATATDGSAGADHTGANRAGADHTGADRAGADHAGDTPAAGGDPEAAARDPRRPGPVADPAHAAQALHGAHTTPGATRTATEPTWRQDPDVTAQLVLPVVDGAPSGAPPAAPSAPGIVLPPVTWPDAPADAVGPGFSQDATAAAPSGAAGKDTTGKDTAGKDTAGKDTAGRSTRRRSRRPAVLAGALAVALLAGGAGAWVVLGGDDDPAGADRPAPAAVASTPAMAPVAHTKVGQRAGGTLVRMDLMGRQSGVRADVWVWLPSQYDRPEYRDHRFPVLVAHSGYPGVGANTMIDGDIGFLAKVADAVRTGKMAPVIVVAPELLPYDKAPAGAPADADLDCSDIPGRPRLATFHTTDVRDAVLATFRAAPERTAWGLVGEGTGGLCATKYALEYPQYWSAAVSLSGRTTLRSSLWPATPEGARAREAATPAALLAARPDVRLLLSTGAADQEGRAANARLLAAAQAPTTVRTTATASGTGATAAEVARQVPEALTFLAGNVVAPGGPAPATTASGRPASAPVTPSRRSPATASRGGGATPAR